MLELELELELVNFVGDITEKNVNGYARKD